MQRWPGCSADQSPHGTTVECVRERMRQYARNWFTGTLARSSTSRCASTDNPARSTRARLVHPRRLRTVQPADPLPDADGMIGGCKGLIDCLRPFDAKRRPYGLGFVRDDGPGRMALHVLAVRVKVADVGMFVTIEPIEPPA